VNVRLEGGPFLYRSLLVSLLCHSIFSVVGGRGLLHQHPLAGGLKRAVLLAPSRERFAVMESGVRFWSAEKRLELERQREKEREMCCEGTGRNSCRLIWCVDQRLVREEL
jgi:hypothetical protein